MKKSLRIIALLLAVLILLCGCGKKESYALKVGDQIVSEGTFARQAATLADYLSEMESDLSDPEEFETYVCDYLTDLKLYAQMFDELGLSFTAEEEAKVDDYLSEVISTYESITAFQQALAEAGYTYEEYLEELYDFEKKSKVLKYYYGPEGEEPVAVQDLMDFYALHNAVIKYVAVSTVDEETGEPLEADRIAEAKKAAEDAYAEATRQSDVDHFAEVIEIYSEDTSTRDTPVVISDADMAEDSLTAKVMEMEVGQVIHVEVDGGYMVIKRYDATAEEHFTADVQQSVLEEYRAEEIEELLEAWKQEIPIKINSKIIEKYRISEE